MLHLYTQSTITFAHHCNCALFPEFHFWIRKISVQTLCFILFVIILQNLYLLCMERDIGFYKNNQNGSLWCNKQTIKEQLPDSRIIMSLLPGLHKTPIYIHPFIYSKSLKKEKKKYFNPQYWKRLSIWYCELIVFIHIKVDKTKGWWLVV